MNIALLSIGVLLVTQRFTNIIIYVIGLLCFYAGAFLMGAGYEREKHILEKELLGEETK